jgi:hypothetical protein
VGVSLGVASLTGVFVGSGASVAVVVLKRTILIRVGVAGESSWFKKLPHARAGRAINRMNKNLDRTDRHLLEAN